MIRKINLGHDESIIDESLTNGLGRFSFYHPVDTFSLTPASFILIESIINNQNLLSGVGIDWGSGVGCLAILASKIKSVEKVYGLEISKENIDVSRINAKSNGVDDKVSFMQADSYSPFNDNEKRELNELRGKVNFIISNPPSSDWDDGFGFRRIVMTGAKDFLADGGVVFLNVSYQYSMERIESLYKGLDEFEYLGVAASTDWVPFDLNREDLVDCLKTYAKEESAGGIEYTFAEDESGSRFINARTALENYNKKAASPFTKWQTHIFRYKG